jgi:biotin operon repressor
MSKFTDKWGTFTMLPKAFIEESRNLSNSARWLFVVLSYYTNEKSECAWPSYDELQERTGYSRTTVSKAIEELEKHGWLERRKRFGKSVVYVLKAPTDDPDSDSSSQNGLLDNKRLDNSSSDSTLVQKMNYRSSKNELQKFKKRTTASYYEQDEENKTNGTRGGADAPPAGKKSRSKSSSATESVPPVIAAIREITNRYPPKVQWPEIVEKCGDDFDPEFLRKCFSEWSKRSTNLGRTGVWLFEWYLNGEIPEQGATNNGSKHGPRKSEDEKLTAIGDNIRRRLSEIGH